MKKLSSDTLYFQSLIGLIIIPFIFYFFIVNFWVSAFPMPMLEAICVLIIIFLIFQWVKTTYSRRVFYDKSSLYLQSYFRKEIIAIPKETATIKVVKGVHNSFNPRLYKLKYEYNGKRHFAYFFKSLDLFFVKDLQDFLRENG